MIFNSFWEILEWKLYVSIYPYDNNNHKQTILADHCIKIIIPFSNYNPVFLLD